MVPVVCNVHIQGLPLIVGVPIAFIGGLLSFVSPCVLPLVPGYLGYLAGTSLDGGAAPDRRLIANGLSFVLGFTAVFTVTGVAIGQFLTRVQSAQGYVRWVGGVVVLMLGFHTLGLIRVPFLSRTLRISVAPQPRERRADAPGASDDPRDASIEDRAVRPRRSGVSLPMLMRSFVIGVFFAAGWSPCVGPILAGIYGVVGARPASGGVLLMVYSLGLGVPFLCFALIFGRISGPLRRLNRFYGVISLASGLFLVGIGLLLLTDTLARLSRYAPIINLPGLS